MADMNPHRTYIFDTHKDFLKEDQNEERKIQPELSFAICKEKLSQPLLESYVVKIDRQNENQSYSVSLNVNLNKFSDNRPIVPEALDGLQLSDVVLSNLHPPGSVISEEESIVSSHNEQSESKESNFSNPMDEAEIIKSKELMRYPSKLCNEDPSRREKVGNSESF